jgi:flagellar biogenesis protein FliO
MPSFVKTVGLMLVMANPAHAAAQTFAAQAARRGQAEVPSVPVRLPQADPTVFRTPGAPLPQPGFQPSRVRQAAWQQPLPQTGPGATGGEPRPLPGGASAAGLLPPQGRESPIPLAPPGRSRRTQQGNRPKGLTSLITVASSLAVVLGIFFLVAWGMRRAAPKGSTALPVEVFEVLGRAPLASRQQAHLLRVGNKLVLVSVTAAGSESITEITDPVEVDRLAGLCRQAHSDSATAAFRLVLQQFAPKRPRSESLSGLSGESDREAGLAGAGVPTTSYAWENRDV